MIRPLINHLGALIISTGLATASIAAEPQAEVQRVIRRFDSFRPADRDLAIFRLDWETSLDAAKRRASSEHRPILLVVVRNSYGDLISGHC